MPDETKLLPCPFCGNAEQDTLLVEHMTAAITTLRAQVAEARTELAFVTENRNKWQDTATRRWFRAEEANVRADRAEAAMAAQIEVDARIAEEDGWEPDKPHLGITEREEGSRDCAERIAAAIRNQHHDRSALDQIIADTRAEMIRQAAQVGLVRA